MAESYIDIHVRKCLTEAETKLRGLAARAAEAGDYSVVERVTRTAKSISDLLASDSTPGEPVGRRESNASQSPKRNTRGFLAEGEGSSGIRADARCRSRACSEDYPRFLRRGEDLVKIGWSKKSKEEYEHKAPWRIILLVASAITRSATEHKLVRSDHFLPIVDDTGEEVPYYQAYLALAWLVAIGEMFRHGRQGYTLRDPKNLTASIEERWRSSRLF